MYTAAALLVWLLAANATVLVVGGGGYPGLKPALIAAKDGDTVHVKPGVYPVTETLRLSKRVVLRGEPGAILDGGSKVEMLVVEADGAAVLGLHFRNAGFSGYEDIAAIRVRQCRNVRIANNRLEHTFFGIYVDYAASVVVENNHLTSTAQGETLSGNGIHSWKSDSLTIRNNFVSGHRDGIYFEFVTHSHVEKNTSVENVRYGIHFMFSNDDTYTDNVFERNGAGIAVMYSNRVVMLRNLFVNNLGDAAYGILLKDINDSRVEHNLFDTNTVGIMAEGSNRIVIKRNRFVNNGWAMKIQANCDGLEIDTNNFARNTFDVATNGSLVLNKFRNNHWDKYDGFDLDNNGIGDVPYKPVSLFSIIVERNPLAMMLYRSAIVYLLDKTERLLPGVTPPGLQDVEPAMKAHVLK
jgi:nitrous oxidase accessory protein